MNILHPLALLVLALLAKGMPGEDIDAGNNTETNLSTNTCFEVAFTPGCSDPVCEEYICDNVDIFCCDRRWDDTCVQAATEQYADACQVDWPDQYNDCFETDPFGRPGCDNENMEEDGYKNSGYNNSLCESIVCESRPECCDISYDAKCVELALARCDLPDPKNSCISESRLPGCLDEQNAGECQESVCSKDETCCTIAYGPQCVELARKDSRSCAPITPPNTCYEQSPFGDCADRRCAANVCNFAEKCCNNEDRIGQWDDNCVTAASSLCKPMIEDRPVGDCPSGMLCSIEQMANCTELASHYKDVLLLGNILGGVYCGDEESGRIGLINCPRGSYCPDPETKLPCPAGYFCPFKTQEPTTLCRRCQEGSTELAKGIYGWIILCIIGLLAAVYIGWGLLNRYNQRLADHLSELEKRFQSNRENLFKSIRPSDSEQKSRDVEKLRPKLEVISYRLAKMEGGRSPTVDGKKESFSGLLDFDGDEIKFDAAQLFDILDVDASGDLTFDELNVIMGLSEMELREFIRRMNEIASSSTTKASVTRSVFAKYFLQVLTDTSNLSISYEEAEAMFDELAGGDKSLNEIDMNKFYVSSMSEFLSDSQILQVIKEFKALKVAANEGKIVKGTAEKQGTLHSRRASMSLRRKSIQTLRTNLSPSSTVIGNGKLETQIENRKSSFDLNIQSRANQQGIRSMIIGREFFIQNYPQVLMDVMLNEDEESDDSTDLDDFCGVDLCFKNLSLTVKVGKQKVDVVNSVTGRIRGKTMNALMGGSGAGKTSLLNALCGRAHYGETTGKVYLNGHGTDIQKHVGCIGFVPQDDIVYAELTVRENFLFAGKFCLPKETTKEEIEELADETIANLGLSRVANSPVGDVKRRGVSGGEKKRVNIGIELMALPSILFLDEPTSGLDSSSALLVMKSLNHLVEKDGVTVVSVIHQPRKFIFDLFDSLILLGVGGKLVYHGSTEGAEPYFGNLGYTLPQGESVADWLIDISSGRLEPNNSDSLDSYLGGKEDSPVDKRPPGASVEAEENPSAGAITKSSSRIASIDSNTRKLQPSGRVLTDDKCVGKKGVTTGKVVRAIEDAKIRRAWLCSEWLKYFENLCDEEKFLYEPPEKYPLPISIVKHSFWQQFIYQVHRGLLVDWRNRLSKIINFTIVVGAVVFISAIFGANPVSSDSDPSLQFSVLVRPLVTDFPQVFGDLFAYSTTQNRIYATAVGVILSIIIGCSAAITLTSKRLEFFREAGSGYDLNAYFFAINTISTVEYSIQVTIAAIFAAWLRIPNATVFSYVVHFVLLAWLTVSWSMLLPMILSPDTVALVGGFFFAFCGLLLSGSFAPVNYIAIYQSVAKEFISGWISPTRFFIEALTVGEYRCTPEQSGFTIERESLARKSDTTMMRIQGFAGRDLNAVRRSCSGWYWSVLPVIFIGITIRYAGIGAMHACFRAQQAKKPFIYAAKRNRNLALIAILYCFGFVALFCVTTWLFMRDQPFEENLSPTMVQMLDKYGFFDR